MIRYNKEKCHECALQCLTISEFSKKFSGAYQNCLKYGWLDEVCSHMKRVKRRNGYWNNENVIEEAKKYTSLKEFRENSSGAYDYAHDKKELIDEIRSFLKIERKPNGYWTYERCYEEAKKYETLIDFHDRSSSAYNSSKNNKWLEKFTWLKSTKNENYGKEYSLEELDSLSKQCTNRTDFKKKYYHAYKYAKVNDLLGNLEFKDIPGVDTYEKLLPDGSVTKVKKTKRVKNIITPSKWTYEKCVEESKKYTYYTDFIKGSASAYATACYRGWIKDFVWLERKRKERGYWNKETCYNEAKKYTRMVDFYENSFVAYNKALDNGWINEYDWLERETIQRDALTYDACYNEAMKYEFLSEFRELSTSVYGKSVKTGWIRDYIWLKRNKSFLEVFFEKNLIKNNVNYEYQKNFEWLKMDGSQFLDFYLPDYNIAVECQGGQHYGESNGSFYADYDLTKKRDENKYMLCKQHGIRVIYYSLKKYNTKHFLYTNVEELFRKELNVEFEAYNSEEIKLFENRRKKAKSFKSSKKNKVDCDIIQKDLDGNEIKRWKSIDDICEEYKCTRGCIHMALRGVNSTAKGFIWERDLSTGKYVYEIDDNGKILYKFDTPEEASRFYGICNFSIRERCDKNNLKPYKGHIFTYHPDDFSKDEFSKINKVEQKPNGYWTYERCYEEAKKYKTFKDFQKNCSSGCTKASKMGWIKEWKLFETHEKITFERCAEVASNYDRIEDFKNENDHLYNAMLKNGWVRKIFNYTGRKVKHDDDVLELMMCEASTK